MLVNSKSGSLFIHLSVGTGLLLDEKCFTIKHEYIVSLLCMLLGHLVFAATEEVSCALQRVENNLQDILFSVDTLI